jgi:hypothetical protein
MPVDARFGVQDEESGAPPLTIRTYPDMLRRHDLSYSLSLCEGAGNIHYFTKQRRQQMNRKNLPCSTVAVLVLVAAMSASAQQQFPQPQPSPAAKVSQTIGVSTVTVTYHRPAVKGRTVWGDLVPYGEVWRAGANENSTVTFSHDVTVEGKALPAGTYGLHMIPTTGAWTVIFSRNATSWGSYYYQQEEDALRVTVTPLTDSHCESLVYEFSDLTDTDGTLSLRWEKVRVPMKLAFRTNAIVLDFLRSEYLRGIPGFGWQGYNQAAQFCLRNNIELPQALAWADRSIALQENFTNIRTKAGILETTGKHQEAKALYDRSMKFATEVDINLLGYQMMNAGKMDDALALFRKNVKDYPDSWNVYDSLAEGLEKSGDIKGAVTNYEKALTKVGDEQNKQRITGTLTRLQSK